MRKDIREGVKKHMIDGIKPNYGALAKQYSCDYRTVKATVYGNIKVQKIATKKYIAQQQKKALLAAQ